MKANRSTSLIVVLSLLFSVLVTGVFIGRRLNRRFIYVEEIQQMEETKVEIPPLNINTATVRQLAALDGVSEELAARIVENRNRWGWYDSVDRLLSVEGFSQKLLDSLRDRLTAERP
ncbi:MAG: helix-hairpin-helix domain-containing protein [Oscillospiraceae bacterium]|nr:helix-hairpin-helix domain-containing protein [Oscillospiraceae bacterium]MBR2897638.1 helix-hairpin-helix domain-containing protein [Oscillospiraceae bacterium]